MACWVGLCLLAAPAAAQSPGSLGAPAPAGTAGLNFLAAPADAPLPPAEPSRPRLSRVTFLAAAVAQAPDGAQAPAPPRPRAIVYSDAYRVRARIHKVASFAMLPLFAAEGYVGQSLYQNPTSGKKNAHLAIATGIGALFGVNSVTGVWNLIEGRKDPHGRVRRLLHAVLLLGADAGFLATAALAPDSEFGERGGTAGRADGSRAAHRAMAFTSISLASAGYLVMLIGGR